MSPPWGRPPLWEVTAAAVHVRTAEQGAEGTRARVGQRLAVADSLSASLTRGVEGLSRAGASRGERLPSGPPVTLAWPAPMAESVTCSRNSPGTTTSDPRPPPQAHSPGDTWKCPVPHPGVSSAISSTSSMSLTLASPSLQPGPQGRPHPLLAGLYCVPGSHHGLALILCPL